MGGLASIRRQGSIVTHPCYTSAAWRKVRPIILARDNWTCKIRGPKCVGKANTVDHIIEIESGGAWYDEDNLRAACEPCNYGRGHRRTHRRRPSRDI